MRSQSIGEWFVQWWRELKKNTPMMSPSAERGGDEDWDQLARVTLISVSAVLDILESRNNTTPSEVDNCKTGILVHH